MQCNPGVVVLTQTQERGVHRPAPGLLYSLEVAAAAGSSPVMFISTEMGLLSVLHFGKLVYMQHGVQAWSFFNNTQRSCCLLGGKKFWFFSCKDDSALLS